MVEAVHAYAASNRIPIFFSDTDPGPPIPGNGGGVTVTPGSSFQQTVQLNVPNLGAAVHYLYVVAVMNMVVGDWQIKTMLLDRIDSCYTGNGGLSLF
ncbi:MAG: hypothetical protein IPN26_10680 [Bacteroidetes bacterium]|nr:hypothetical protein [Bacteroidota bacterium]